MSGLKQSLNLRLGQQLAMTPQLQQAIRLLQLSTLDLRTEIQQALDSNLMLEAVDESEATDAAADAETNANEERAGGEDIPEELPVDSSWDEIYDGSTSYSAPDPDAQFDLLENHSDSAGGLREHLLWQADMSPFTDQDRAIAETLIDAIRDDGYLGQTLEEIQGALPPEWEVELDEIHAVLSRIQRFDPLGVGARDPREALLIQLDNLDFDSPWAHKARELVDQHLELLVNRQYKQLFRRLSVTQDELQEIIALIQTLNPRPGSAVDSQRTEYVVPDVYVHKAKDEWRVELNREALPKLRINSYYASLIKRADSSSDNTTMRSHLQEARWFLKSLQSRHETLLKVARAIVHRQQGFFEHGEEAMKPLVLREVAEEVDMHESTISRITTQKFMYTPRGTFEFKYFFSSHVMTVDGDECSATAIRARIRRLVAAEDPSKPLSDSKIADILQEEGINVARRTVAKYREAMNIASSTERKRLA